MLTTQAFQSGMFSPNQSEISPAQLASLLRGKKFGTGIDDNSFDPLNSANYSEEDLKELQDYCSKRGIIGVSFKGMNPKAVLQMLKAKTGDRSGINESKKELLHG